MNRNLAILLGLTISCLSRSAAQETNMPLDNFIEQKMKEAGIVGLGASVITHHTVRWTKGYGFADKDKQVPFLPTTIINVGGISKTVLGFCLLKAVEENKLSLDEDINVYLPFKVINPFFPGDIITLRQLASHSACIADQHAVYDSTYVFGNDSPEPLGSFLENYFVPSGKYYKKENYLDKEPGTFFQYSNIASALAAYVIEVVTGEKFNEFTKRVLFNPLNMSDSGWLLSDVNLANHSRLYKIESDTLKEFALYGFTTYPDGGLRTSVSELSKFLACIANEGKYNHSRILQKALALEMIKPRFTPSTRPVNLDLERKNYGVFVPIWVSENRIGNTGSDYGVLYRMFYDTDKRIGVILLINTALSGERKRNFDMIFDELWNLAIALSKNRQ
jgi:CubicO group peptidase (beta-lactamase class C family)